LGGIKRLIPLCQYSIAVFGDDLARPCKGVDRPDACRLWSYPQLQVLGAVVVSDAVAVMHVLARQEIPAKELLHDENVLEDVAAVTRFRVLRSPDQRVPVSVPAPPASPIVVRWAALGVAGGTCGRLALLSRAARAEVAGPAGRAAQVAA
jgi:hypothetical protein